MPASEEVLLPLSDHIAELRSTLLQSIFVFVLTFVLLLFAYQPLLDFLTAPYVKATLTQSSQQNPSRLPLTTQLITNTSSKDIHYSCKECGEIPLNWSAGTTQNADQFLIPPGGTLLIAKESNNKGLILLSPAEGFLSVMKISFWGALLLSTPFWGFFLYRFIHPALLPEQQSFVFPFACASLLCISAGIAFAYFFVIPAANQYLMLFNGSVGENLWTMERYLDYTLLLLLANGIAFELAAILFLAIRSGFLKAEMLTHYRRHTIVAAFILAALLTPPDILTQFLLAVPLCLLYEVGIIYAKLKEKTG